MKRFAFLIATILALASADIVQARGVAIVQQRVVVRSRFVVQPVFAVRQRVIVQPIVQQQFVQPYVQQFRLGFNAGYGQQLNLGYGGVQQLNVVGDGCGVQAFSAGYGGQAVILRSRVCH